MGETDSPWYKLMHYGLEFFGLYYSSYRGFVLDNDDPKKMNRIKVTIPAINPNDRVGIWAYPKNNWGGKDYGTNLLPLNKDMVFIEFDNGNSECPIWSHAGYALGEKPEEFNETTSYGIKTPNKTLIIVEDGKSQVDGKILVKFKSGEEYFLIEKNLFELEANRIKLGKNGDEQAVLGNTLMSKMEDILSKLEITHNILTTHTHTTNAGPSGPPIQSSQLINIKQGLTSIKNNLQTMLSNKVKLDK